MLSKIQYFHGMKRSGHHAVLRWIISCISKPVLFSNNITAWCKDRDLRKTKELSIGTQRYNHWENRFDNMLKFANIEDRSDILFDDIVILRDPYNCLASRIQHFGHLNKKEKLWTNFLTLWKDHARSYINNTSKFVILYNYWMISSSYRSYIANMLSLDILNHDTNVKSNNVGGAKSRFSNPTDYFNRYRAFLNDDRFTSAIDSEIVGLSRKIFPDFTIL